jgi:hypothetical protein
MEDGQKRPSLKISALPTAENKDVSTTKLKERREGGLYKELQV